MSATQIVEPLDMSKSPVEILVSKYNAINGMSVAPTDVTLGPVFTTATDPRYNTSVDLIPNASSIYLNTRKIYYRRTTLLEAMSVASEVKSSGNEYLYQILDAVNAAYGTSIKEADVEDAVIQYSNPADRTSPGTVVLQARGSSYFYTGIVTLTVNTPHRLGNNLYENELAFAVVERQGNTQSIIKIIDIYGQPVTDFVLFKDMTLTYVNVVAAWVLDDRSLTVIGRFDAVENGVTTPYRAVTMDQRGNVIAKRPGNVYGLTRGDPSGFRFIPDKATGQVYCIDDNNVIGGRNSRLHRYNPDGTYDTAFPDLFSSPVSSLAIDGSRLYVGIYLQSTYSVTCVSKVSYIPPVDWTHINFLSTAITKNSAVMVDQFGPRVNLDVASSSQPWQVAVGGELITSQNQLRPSLVFSFDNKGVLRADWKRKRNAFWSMVNRFHASNALAQNFSVLSAATGSGTMAFPAYIVLCVDEEGNYHAPQHGPLGTYPLHSAPPKFQDAPNADILAFGPENYADEAGNTVLTREAINVYASTGRFAGRIYMAPYGNTIEQIIPLVGDEGV